MKLLSPYLALLVAIICLSQACGGDDDPERRTADRTPQVEPTARSSNPDGRSTVIADESSGEITVHAGGFSGTVDVGGFSLYIECRGSGAPAVIFESGAGGGHGGWNSIWDEVAETTTACAYDRAASGDSDRRPGAPAETIQPYIDELHTLLDDADVPEPYVLVSHSAGGYYSRLFAGQYPDEVAGLVLLDARHEAFDLRQRDILPAVLWTREVPHGLLLGYLDVTDREATLELLQEEAVLQPMPLVVIEGGQTFVAIPPGFTAAQNEAVRLAWSEVQKTVADSVLGGEYVYLADTNHGIHYEQPDFVIAYIRRVVESVRAGCTQLC
ncbi:MAG: alpha/beta hydrolase [Dehalococcoidia bacterium]